jgi:hypothetical protein
MPGVGWEGDCAWAAETLNDTATSTAIESGLLAEVRSLILVSFRDEAAPHLACADILSDACSIVKLANNGVFGLQTDGGAGQPGRCAQAE